MQVLVLQKNYWFVEDLVSAYVQLGGAKLEVVVEKVLAHLKTCQVKRLMIQFVKNVNDLKKRIQDEMQGLRESMTNKERNNQGKEAKDEAY